MKKKKIIIGIALLILIIAIAVTVILLIINNKQKNNKPEDVQTDFYVADGGIYEKTGNMNENAITSNIEKINNVYDKYLQNMNVYFTTIPDKTYYLENKIDSDFSNIQTEIEKNLNSNINYFDISNSLTLGDYYKTDMHWKQENLNNVVSTIQNEMKISKREVKYEEKSLGDFYGAYYKEIDNMEKEETISENEIVPTNSVAHDELKYLTNEEIENSKVYNEETKQDEPIYNLEKVEETGNKYDMFLSGASSIQIIQNQENNTGNKLIIFRDSFGSSLAPLLINNYEEILLIDLRYVNYNILENYIDFSEYENSDVLFIYSSRVINKTGILR